MRIIMSATLHTNPTKLWLLEDQPSEKFLSRGISALTDAELLALILRSGESNGSAIDLGRELLSEFDGLRGIARASVKDLMQVKGIGRVKAISICVAFEIGRRKAQQIICRHKLNSAEAVYQYLSPTLADLDHEVFYVLYLNRNHELKSAKQLFEGGVDATVIDTRIIFKEAVTQLASSIILIHNHPSGAPRSVLI